jgi:hypothetical protein
MRGATLNSTWWLLQWTKSATTFYAVIGERHARPLIFESALSFPWPTSTKSKDAFPCVKPKVKSRRSSGFSRQPSRFIAFPRPVTLAQTFAITSVSCDKSEHCSRTAFRRALAAFLPPSTPCCTRSVLNCGSCKSATVARKAMEWSMECLRSYRRHR